MDVLNYMSWALYAIAIVLTLIVIVEHVKTLLRIRKSHGPGYMKHLWDDFSKIVSDYIKSSDGVNGQKAYRSSLDTVAIHDDKGLVAIIRAYENESDEVVYMDLYRRSKE